MSSDGSCIFCRIAAGEFGTTFLYESDAVVAFEDLAPQAKTHVLVVPRQHITSIADVGLDDGSLLAEMIVAANTIARERGLNESGYRLLTNNGPDAGQTVMHLHVHLLGGNELAALG